MLIMSLPLATCSLTASSPASKAAFLSKKTFLVFSSMMSTISFRRRTRLLGTRSRSHRLSHLGPNFTRNGVAILSRITWKSAALIDQLNIGDVIDMFWVTRTRHTIVPSWPCRNQYTEHPPWVSRRSGLSHLGRSTQVRSDASSERYRPRFEM